MKNKTITSAELKAFINSDEFELIVQKNHEKYKHKWWLTWAKKEENISLTSKMSWNWSAFLFQAFWFLYRKMYLEFSIVLSIQLIGISILAAVSPRNFDAIVSVIASGGTSLLSIVNIINQLLGISMMVVIGIYGNAWYLKRCLKLADTAHQEFDSSTLGTGVGTDMDDTPQGTKNRFLKESGGTNLKGLLSYLGAFMILFVSGYVGVPILLVSIANIALNISILLYIYFNFFHKKVQD